MRGVSPCVLSKCEPGRRTGADQRCLALNRYAAVLLLRCALLSDALRVWVGRAAGALLERRGAAVEELL